MDRTVLLNLFTIANCIFIVLLIYAKARLYEEKIVINWNVILGLFCVACFGFLSALAVGIRFESKEILYNYFVHIYIFENFMYLLIAIWVSKRFYKGLIQNQFLLIVCFYWSLFPIFYFVFEFFYICYMLASLDRL